ncbi:MAG: mitochondrial fission ELM1 family protein [Rhodospirillales bacterium]|jgi:hypothetical protein|nr:mitochondrial fission ELM1 family protein [Rhodospirillales bacterium]
MKVSGGPAAPPAVWLLIDDRAGNRGQCLGVAEALGLDFRVRDIEYSTLGGLPNGLIGASFAALTGPSRVGLAPPWPDLLIAAGRRTAPVARAIKRRNRGATFLAQIMDPGSPGAADFDLIAQPTHDGGPRRPNGISIIGAPHLVTADRLAEAADQWRGRFEPLARPWIALIVGGSTRRRPFTDEAARRLGRLASAMAREAGGSLLVSTSRRTGAAEEPLLAAIDAPHRIHRWGEAGDNPYFGYLALADAVVVTGDSVSMCCEACAVPAPVYIYAPDGATQSKHARLHAELFEKGYARPMTERLETWSHPPLNAAQDVAREIAARLAVRANARGQRA